MSEDTVRIGRYRVINFPTTATFIGFGVFSLTAAIVILLFTKEVPHENVAPLNIVIGIILGCLGTVVAFYFEDSKKSSLQQDTINTLAQKPVEAVVVAADKQIQAAEKQTQAADTQLAAAEKKD
jgi:hypothetical protein